jgi:hypothetical protein
MHGANFRERRYGEVRRRPQPGGASSPVLGMRLATSSTSTHHSWLAAKDVVLHHEPLECTQIVSRSVADHCGASGKSESVTVNR